MNTFGKALIMIVGSLVALVGIGWVGLQIPPKPFPPPPEKTRDRGTVDLPPDLPEPVYRHFKATLGSEVPRVDSAIVWGRATIKTGLWMPLRFKAHYLPGHEFHREMEITWFGLPLLKATDSYLNGAGAMNIGGNVSTGQQIDQGQVLVMWAEGVLMPSVLVTDPRIRWEVVDDVTARLIVPFAEQEEMLLVKFDPQTGLMTQMSALRYRGQEGEKTPWRVEFLNWKSFQAMMIPTRVVVTWEDEGSPWSFWTIEGAEYNVDVSEKIPGATAGSRQK